MKLSAVVLTNNSEKTLGKCLESLDFSNETLVIDDNSSDKTVSIANSFGAKVITRSLDNDYSSQRNFALKQAKGEYVLFVDSDEVISVPLKNQILAAIYNSSFDGYSINRKDFWLGKQLEGGENGAINIVRLGKKEKGLWKRRVHEYWEINGKVGFLDGYIYHYPHETFSDFINSINSYSAVHASENLKEGKESTFFRVVFYPFYKFLQNFIYKKGYKDGTHGFVAAVIMSLHSFLAWSDIWIQQNLPTKPKVGY